MNPPSHQVNDPYLLPNGILRNRFGATVQAELDARESRAVSARQALLDARSYFGLFDFSFLCKIHRFLFQDVYDWAGEPRTVGLAKHDVEGPESRLIGFTPARLVAREAARIFSSLPSVEELASAPDEFASLIGEFLVGLNNLHPFREGNGRTQRLFIRYLGRRLGIDVAWDVVTRERMVAASVEGAIGNSEPMRRLIREIIDQDRVRALRKALDFLKRSKSVPWNDLYISTTVAGQTYRGILVGRSNPDFMMRANGIGDDWIAVGHTDDIPEDVGSGEKLIFTSRRW